MATIKQIKANRSNAKKSTGSKTPEGKEASASTPSSAACAPNPLSSPLPGEGGQNLGDDPHRGKDEDVDLRMAEDPEEVLPEDRQAAVRHLEEVRSEEPVHHELDEGYRDRREREDDQERGEERHPGEHRQPHHRH